MAAIFKQIHIPLSCFSCRQWSIVTVHENLIKKWTRSWLETKVKMIGALIVQNN